MQRTGTTVQPQCQWQIKLLAELPFKAIYMFAFGDEPAVENLLQSRHQPFFGGH